MTPHDPSQTDSLPVAVGKMLTVWLAWFAGISLGEWVQLAALVFTCLQIYVLVRDKLWRKNP